jgi:hypothetical protein
MQYTESHRYGLHEILKAEAMGLFQQPSPISICSQNRLNGGLAWRLISGSFLCGMAAALIRRTGLVEALNRTCPLNQFTESI